MTSHNTFSSSSKMSSPTSPAILVENLTFSYGGATILSNLSLQLPPRARCLLVGSNGAGSTPNHNSNHNSNLHLIETTLLRILAGKRLVKNPVRVLGKDVYNDTPAGLTYLGPEWAANPVVRRDVTVSSLLKSMNAEKYPERTQKLMDLLDINDQWHMHEISDGERRRVQMLLGLVEPFRALLLDEVTVDLDVLVRRNLLEFLRGESEQGATMMYATHIFDGLGSWPTHVAHVRRGSIVRLVEMSTFPELEAAKAAVVFDSPLLQVIERWLREDRELQRAAKQEPKQDTVWDRLSDMKRYGDKYYDYWNQ